MRDAARAEEILGLDTEFRRARLSDPRAEYLFKTASAELDPHGQGWTLRQPRH